MATLSIPADLDFPDVDKPYVERIHGRDEPKVSSKRRHALLQYRLAATLDLWAGERGEVGTEWRCYLIAGEDRPSSLVPDVAYYSFARLPRDLDDDERERPRIAPDVAVEIFSPGDRRKTLAQKIALYLAHGAALVVVVDPCPRTVVLHDATGSKLLDARGTIVASLPLGLELDCAALFRGV